MTSIKRSCLIALVISLAAVNAIADGAGHVSAVVPVGYTVNDPRCPSSIGNCNMPNSIGFSLDAAVNINSGGTCPAGAMLHFTGTTIEETKSVYAMLLAAFLNSKLVSVYAVDTNCSITTTFVSN